MPVTSVTPDTTALTLTVHAEVDAPVARAWDAFFDPRQLEKFWGPPGFPATFTRHDGHPQGHSSYYMTSPEGEKYHGFWVWNSVVKHQYFEVTDGFALDDGAPNPDLPTSRMTCTFDTTDAGTRLRLSSTYNTEAEFEQVMGMGAAEGIKQAFGQLDDVLDDLQSYAADRPVQAQILSDTQLRLSRIVTLTPQHVWDAHHDPEIIRRWMIGPDGWRMADCVVPTDLGGTFHNSWEPEPGHPGEPFGFTGQLLEQRAPVYERTTEAMVGTDQVPAINELTLTPVSAGTLLSIVITYPDHATRDAVLATGMPDGMEASYARLERLS